ncbi:low temperature requirement protein A [Rugosimonospora africana]|uniref:Membrane protein n=1 Tax=Rugosimonospora africana TaxID=556532 RepID=A0A8J3VW67_9ACTN|nr:low temperature requirement protein A [Rugosimonospora africana]GIH21432.1 membrane protein [Rugosimonospora africana]
MDESDRAPRVRGEAGWQRPSFLELFFDLVFVFAFNQVSLRLINDFGTGNRLQIDEVGRALVLFLALWMLWLSTAFSTSRGRPESTPGQVMVFMAMAGATVMAVAVAKGFEGRAFVFAGAYVAARVSRFLLAVRLRQAEHAPVWGWFSVGLSAVPWVLGGLVDDRLSRGVLWVVALALDYGGFALTHRRTVGAPIAGEHLAERLQQFLLIALGEAIFLSGRALTNSSFGIPQGAGFGLAFVGIALLWRIYFYRAGSVLPLAISRARERTRESVAVAGSHLLMIVGIVLSGVGFDLYIVGPLTQPRPDFLVAILGGPALVLAGRALFERQVFSRISRSRLVGLLALGLLVPAAWYVPPLAAGGAVVVVLAAIAVWDGWRARGRAPEPPVPPI